MKKRLTHIILIFSLLCSLNSQALDTLYTNPNYPPLVYTNAEYNFFKYTPKYVPDNLLHAFKILGTHSADKLNQFKKKTIGAVLLEGIFQPKARLRKQFCLDGYSAFVSDFHSIGIYYPFAMETYTLLCFHQYLNQLEIDWKENKRLALSSLTKQNRAWKKRRRKLFKGDKVRIKEAKAKKKKRKQENDADLFWFSGEIYD